MVDDDHVDDDHDDDDDVVVDMDFSLSVVSIDCLWLL